MPLLTNRLLVIVYAGVDMPLYAFALFLPSIINQVSSCAPYSVTSIDLHGPAWYAPALFVPIH